MNTPSTHTQTPPTDISERKLAGIAGVGLLVMAIVAPIAFFVVIPNLVIPGNVASTIDNIAASNGMLRIGVALFLGTAILDFVVAWALYLLLRPVNQGLSLLTAWLRAGYAAVLAVSTAHLLDVARLVGDTGSTLPTGQLQAQVTTSLASFDNTWRIGLAIFGLHLVGLGWLVFRSMILPRFLGGLVVVAGAGYLLDSFGRILFPDYSLAASE